MKKRAWDVFKEHSRLFYVLAILEGESLSLNNEKKYWQRNVKLYFMMVTVFQILLKV